MADIGRNTQFFVLFCYNTIILAILQLCFLTEIHPFLQFQTSYFFVQGKSWEPIISVLCHPFLLVVSPQETYSSLRHDSPSGGLYWYCSEVGVLQFSLQCCFVFQVVTLIQLSALFASFPLPYSYLYLPFILVAQSVEKCCAVVA